MRRTSVLVTGGAGFIGSNLVARLVADGYQVRVLDDLSTGRRENLSDIPAEVEFVEGDLVDPDVLQAVVRGVSVVFHHAAIASVVRSVEDPLAVHRVNASGTIALLDAARGAGVDKLVYAASSSAYGTVPEGPISERRRVSPISTYAATKLSGEFYCGAFTSTYGLPTVALRYFNVFGPRQDPASEYAAVIPAFANTMLRGGAPTVYGDGLQTRDFVYVDDVAEANVLAARAPSTADGRAFNIGEGTGRSLLELIEALRGVIGPNLPPPIFAPARPGDPRHSCADISAARRVLGFEPGMSFPEGLRRTVAWLAATSGGLAAGSRTTPPGTP